MSRVFKAGEVYSFKTSPFNKFSEQDTQRYACLKILTPEKTLGLAKNISVGFVILEGIYANPPTIDVLKNAAPLIQKRFGYGELTPFQRKSKNPPKNYATCSSRLDWTPDLLEFNLVGELPLSDFEEKLGANNKSFSNWGVASRDAEGEWRWENDRNRLIIERDLGIKEKEQQEEVARHRFETRLSKLTWEKLAAENLFERWVESPPFPPSPFRDALTVLIRSQISDLRDLGDKYPRAKVRKSLKALVEEITVLNEKFDYVIETEEREDIYGVFDDLTFLSKQRALMEEIPDWHYLEW